MPTSEQTLKETSVRSGNLREMKITVRNVGNNQTYDISCSFEDRVEGLKRKLVSKLDTPADKLCLILGARTLSDEETLGKLGIHDGCTLMLVVRTPSAFKDTSVRSGASKEMRIFVKSLTGRTCDVLCSPEDTVLDLKLKYEERFDSLDKAQRLIFNGKRLEDEKTLGEYGIEHNSCLHMPLILRGGCLSLGVGFDFASMESGRKRGFSANGGPAYRTIGHGFNLEGCCMNKKCKAFQKMAWSNLGFSCSAAKATSNFQTIGFNIGVELYRTPCPLCKKSFDPKSIVSCGFYQCKYTYEGYQQGSGSVSKGSGKASDKDGIEYHDGMMESKGWASLIIVVEPL